MTIIFPGEYISLNEYVNAERRNRFIGAKIKKEETARAQYIAQDFDPLTRYPLHTVFVWYTKTERKDPDNVSFATKFFFDGLVESGVLRNDTRKEIASTIHIYKTDKTNPRVELLLVETFVEALQHAAYIVDIV